MLLTLLIIFIIVPAMELSVLIKVGAVLGSFNTILLCIFTAVIGASLVRSQGVSTLMQAQKKMAQGEMPSNEIVEGMMLAMAGVLLVIPGFVTDFIGLLLLTPFTRKPMAKFLLKRMQLKAVSGGFNQHFGSFEQNPFKQDGKTFDGEYEHKTDANDPDKRLSEKDKQD